ncbi:Ubiquitin conjugation factor E4 B [Fasciola gigantica]|uniref:Ubiquitin conjugation factor E4 B n=1 Tax=Fasciola gigantica TaxID=46835 RepID=A0A504YTL6_FASGI|nr:Ubiquitin conjugation factor E4 B [Fasciola gigantica]
MVYLLIISFFLGYYKSLCFDLISSTLLRIRVAYVQTLHKCDFKGCAPVECFLLEYLCNCVHRLRVEKDRITARSLDLTNTSPLESLNELGCQLHRHIRLTLSGLFSVNTDQAKPSHNPGDLWLSTDLIESPLLRLTAPHTLPPHTSLWALANACIPGSSLDEVITADLLEVPPGASEVLCNLLSELQLEMATTGIETDVVKSSKVYSLQTIFRQLLMCLHFRISQLSIDRQDYAHLLSSLVNLSNTTLVDGARPINQLPSVVESSFPNAHMTEANVQHSTDSLQLSYDLIWNLHFTLIKSLLAKVSDLDPLATRSETLEFLTRTLLHNADHGKIQCDQRVLSGEGFMLNMTVLFQRLSAPINVDSVDPRYLFYRNCRVDFNDATRISGTQEELMEFQNRLASELDLDNQRSANRLIFNFSTECFFLTAWAMQLGFQNSIRRYHRRLQVITDLTRNIKLLSASRSHWAGPQSSAGKRISLVVILLYQTSAQAVFIIQSILLFTVCLLIIVLFVTCRKES